MLYLQENNFTVLRKRALSLVFLVCLSLPENLRAEFDLKCYLRDNCSGNWRSASPNPSTGNQIKINPAAVPTEAGFGLEGLFYQNEVDVALVRGNGRIGAAISPSNSEETFFGPPGFETLENYLERKKNSKKFPSQKITVAAAMNVVNRQGDGLSNYSLKIGLLGKYNKFTNHVSPGAGLSGTLGPFYVGASYYGDETLIEDPRFLAQTEPYKMSYRAHTFNAGFFLNSLILDYSRLRLTAEDDPETTDVALLTASLLAGNFILTAAQRTEESARPLYNYETKQLEFEREKRDIFFGAQYRVNKNVMVGIFHNYYLLREFSLSGTLFF